jgi:hypothetical protein
MSEKLLTRLNDFASQWIKDLEKDDLQKLLGDTENFVDDLAQQLSSGTGNSPEERNYQYVGSVFIRGLYDYIQICMVLQDSNWYRNADLLDYVWRKYWDCKTRFDFSQNIAGGDFSDHLSSLLTKLASFYQAHFGNGMYLSPDLLIRRLECSICAQDFRACGHISGRLYNGIMCRTLARGIELKRASILEHPEDPRCRIWPWNYDPNTGKFKGTMLTMFQIDDFLFNKAWAKMGQPAHAGYRVSAAGPATPDA